MDKEVKCMLMAINIRANSSMDYQKDMENIVGLMGHCTKEILNKELEMDMGFGEAEKELIKHTKGIICLIKNMDMEYMIGGMDTFTKDFGWMI